MWGKVKKASANWCCSITDCTTTSARRIERHSASCTLLSWWGTNKTCTSTRDISVLKVKWVLIIIVIIKLIPVHEHIYSHLFAIGAFKWLLRHVYKQTTRSSVKFWSKDPLFTRPFTFLDKWPKGTWSTWLSWLRSTSIRSWLFSNKCHDPCSSSSGDAHVVR